MTDIRELLREATDSLPVDTADPVDLVRRGVARRRRTGAAIGAVIAAVIAAIVLPLSLAGGGSGVTTNGQPHRFHPPATRPVVQHWAPDDGDAASGFGSIWGLACCGRISGNSWVDRLNPATGARIDRVSVPTPTSLVGAGAGYVWVIGANAGGGGPSAISAIDPVSYRVVTMHITDPRAEPYAIAFAAGSAWVTVPDVNQVWRLTASATGISRSVIKVPGQPWTIATTGNGAIWVQSQSNNRLSEIQPYHGSGRVVKTVTWGGPVFGPFGRNDLLAAQSTITIGALDPALLSKCNACARGEQVFSHGQPFAAVQTSRGIFVGTTRHLYFFSQHAIGRGGQPSGSLPETEAGPIAVDGDGVVIGTGDNGLIHWVPAG